MVWVDWRVLWVVLREVRDSVVVVWEVSRVVRRVWRVVRVC